MKAICCFCMTLFALLFGFASAQAAMDLIGVYHGQTPDGNPAGTLEIRADGKFATRLPDPSYNEEGTYTVAGNTLTLLDAASGASSVFHIQQQGRVLAQDGGFRYVRAASPQMPAPLPAHSQPPLTPDAYARLFLTAADLPPGTRRTQDSRAGRPDPGDTAFGQRHGQNTGMAVWMNASDEAPVWRVVDIRWVFPSAADAQRYLASTWKVQSEGMPPVPHAPAVGSECRWFGGTHHEPVLDADMTQYLVLFRVGRVVVKLFVAQGPTAPNVTLTVPLVQSLLKKAAARVNSTAHLDTKTDAVL